MAVVAPFRGVRFNLAKIKSLDDIVTPPYDVINEKEGKTFLDKNEYNMIRLDLRNDSQSQEATSNRYREARDLFVNWQNEDVLIRDDKPAIYLYYIDYTHPSGRHMTRKGLVSLVRLAEFSEGIVKPHEKTFDNVIADRLELMDECKAQFSKVFSIYSDKENNIIDILEKAREPEVLYSVKDHNDNIHTIWRVSDTKALGKVRELFTDKTLYIADGHHRYTTALNYRKRALQRNPRLPSNNPANFIMMYLCSMEDEGLSILPTHRLVTWPGGMSGDELKDRMQLYFEIEEIIGASRETLIGETLARMNEFVEAKKTIQFGAYHPGEDRCFLLRLKEGAYSSSIISKWPRVLQDLDVVVFSEMIVNEGLGLDHNSCLKEKLISYFSDPDEAIDIAVKKSVSEENITPLLFLLNPTRVIEVMNVADQDEIMPHKSTFFYPKIITGLLLYKLDDTEHID